MSNKLTDNEIVKALECCKKDDCDNCPNDFGNCYSNLSGYALDLINRQKAEIERLNKEVDRLSQCVLYHDGQIVDTIKEFAEKVNREIVEAIISNDKAIVERERKHNVNRYEDNFCAMCDGKVIALGGIKSFINNLLEELVGDEQ